MSSHACRTQDRAELSSILVVRRANMCGEQCEFSALLNLAGRGRRERKRGEPTHDEVRDFDAHMTGGVVAQRTVLLHILPHQTKANLSTRAEKNRFFCTHAPIAPPPPHPNLTLYWYIPNRGPFLCQDSRALGIPNP